MSSVIGQNSDHAVFQKYLQSFSHFIFRENHKPNQFLDESQYYKLLFELENLYHI